MPCLRPSSLSAASRVAGRHRLAVQRDAVAALEIDRDRLGRVGRVLRVDGARIDVVGHLVPRILEHLALGRGVQQVGVGRERRFAALVLGDRDLVLLGEVDQRGAAGQVPFAPRRDDLDVGVERVIAELEADLVVALAGRAVADRVGADLRARSRSGAWRSAAARSRCRAGTAPRRAHWRASSGRRSRGRTPRAGRR